jgi:hypothetical protein
MTAASVQGLAFQRQEEILPRTEAVQKYQQAFEAASIKGKEFQKAKREPRLPGAGADVAVVAAADAAAEAKLAQLEEEYRKLASRERRAHDALIDKDEEWRQLGARAAGLYSAAVPELAVGPFEPSLMPLPGTLALLAPTRPDSIPGTPHGRRLRATVVTTPVGMHSAKDALAKLGAANDAREHAAQAAVDMDSKPSPASARKLDTARALEHLHGADVRAMATGAGVLKVLLQLEWADLTNLGLCSRVLPRAPGPARGLWDHKHCVLTWALPWQVPGPAPGTDPVPAQGFIGVALQQLLPGMFGVRAGANAPVWLPPRVAAGCQRLAWALARVEVATHGLSSGQSLALQEELAHALGMWLPVESAADADCVRLGAVSDWTRWPPVVRDPEAAKAHSVDTEQHTDRVLETLELYPGISGAGAGAGAGSSSSPSPSPGSGSGSGLDHLELLAKQTRAFMAHLDKNRERIQTAIGL